MKAYTVFNVEQIEGLPAALLREGRAAASIRAQRIEHAEAFFAATGADIRHGGNQAYYAVAPDYVQMPPFECLPRRRKLLRDARHECSTGLGIRRGLTATSAASAGATKATPRKSSSPNSAPPSCAPISSSTPEPREDHAPTSPTGSRR